MKTKTLQQFLIGIGTRGKQALEKGQSREQVLMGMAYELSKAWSSSVAETLPSFLIAWAECGFSTVEMGHTLAASLMATRVSKDVVDALHLPWWCFAVEVPNGMIETQLMLILLNPAGQYWTVRFAPQWVHAGFTLRLSEYADAEDLEARDDVTEIEKREGLLIGRLLVGVCLEMENVNSSSDGGGGVSKRKSDEPERWTYRLTRPVKLNVVKEVRDFANGAGGSSPTVQSLIRGHWRRQPCGPDLLLRKWIHIEPYWRGPEDAPIATRSHVLTNDETK